LSYLGGANSELDCLFSLLAAYFFFKAALYQFKAIHHEFNPMAASLMAAPILLAALLFSTRSLVLLLLPEQQVFVSHRSQQAMPLLWSFVILTLAINITIIGSALARLVSKIRLMAEHDQLTGLFNRRAVLKKLQLCHDQLQKQQIPYGLVLLDLDHFKQINDLYGHDAGDAALQQCADSLRRAVRPDDILSRYGGEEFLLLLPNCAEADVETIAKRVCHTIEHHPLYWQQHQLPLSASLGHIWADPGLTVEQLLHLADQAMYQAKHAGRNTCVKAQITPLTPSCA